MQWTEGEETGMNKKTNIVTSQNYLSFCDFQFSSFGYTFPQTPACTGEPAPQHFLASFLRLLFFFFFFLPGRDVNCH